MRAAIVLAAALALAGCASPASEPASPSESAAPSSASPDASTPNATRVLEASFDLTVRAGSASAPASPKNCVFVSLPDGARIVSGEAEATWVASTPFASTLELVAGAGAGSALERKSGGSPLTVHVPAMSPGDAPFIAVQVPEASANVAIDQAVELRVRLEGQGPVEFGGPGACTTY